MLAKKTLTLSGKSTSNQPFRSQVSNNL